MREITRTIVHPARPGLWLDRCGLNQSPRLSQNNAPPDHLRVPPERRITVRVQSRMAFDNGTIAQIFPSSSLPLRPRCTLAGDEILWGTPNAHSQF